MASASATKLVEVNIQTLGRHAVNLGGVLCLLAYAYLCINSQAYGQATLSQLYLVMGICIAVTLGLYGLHRRAGVQFGWPQVVFFAVAFRALGLIAYPVLEDDHFRYLWDGFVFMELGNPYGIAPAEFFAADAPLLLSDRFEAILDGINYPQVPTVYGPTAQLVFAAAYLLAPGAIWPVQLICIMADLAIVLMLLRLVPLLARARPVLGDALAERALATVAEVWLPDEGPCLVHGDLWAGNVLDGPHGPVLIDPSCPQGDRGLDLAMMQLFGGFGPACMAAYEEVYPIPDTLRAALPAYRLVHLLVHVVLFGTGYVSGVRRALAELEHPA